MRIRPLGKVSSLDGVNHALVFASQKLLKVLTTCTEIHVDATFKMVPPMFTQLMTLNVIKHNLMKVGMLRRIDKGFIKFHQICA